MRAIWWGIGGAAVGALGLAAFAVGGGPGASIAAGSPAAERVRLMAALQANPRDTAGRRRLAETYLALGNGVGAEVEIRRAVADGLPKSRAAPILAHALLLQNDFIGALGVGLPPGIGRNDAAYAARIRGRTQMILGNPNAAAAEFRRALGWAPNDARLWADIGRVRMQTGDLAAGATAAGKAVAIDPGNVEVLVLMGQSVRARSGLVASLPWFERALVIDPQNVPAMAEAAATLGDIGRYRDMLAMTRRILKIDPHNANAFFLQATLAARAGRYDLARRLMQRVGGRLDTVPAALLLSGALDYEAGALEQAIGRLGRLIQLQPENIKARRLLGAAMLRANDPQGAILVLRPLADRPGADSYTMSVMGRALETVGDRVGAAPYLQCAADPVAVEGAPFVPNEDLTTLVQAAAEQPNDARTAIPLIRGLINAGNATGALDQAQKLQRDNPGAPAAHILVGDALAALGRPAEAAGAYQRAATIDFSEPVALRLINARARAGDPAGATRVLNLYLAQNPRSVPALTLAAQRFGEAGDWPQAIAILEDLRRRLGDRDVAMLTNLARAYVRIGRPDAALPYARRAYELSPANPAATDIYGWTVFRKGDDRGRAIALLEKATALAPDQPRFGWHLAQAYAAAGRRGAARRAAEAVLVHPDFPERPAVEALLKRL